jgi:hypothetical protein
MGDQRASGTRFQIALAIHEDRPSDLCSHINSAESKRGYMLTESFGPLGLLYPPDVWSKQEVEEDYVRIIDNELNRCLKSATEPLGMLIFRLACEFGHANCVTRLRTRYGTMHDLSMTCTWGMFAASRNRDSGVMNFLLQDRSIRFRVQHLMKAFKDACSGGNTEVARLFLVSPRLNLSFHDKNEALKIADIRKQVELVHLLVNDEPRLMMLIYRKGDQYSTTGALREELTHWENRSAFLLLLCVKRCQTSRTAARVSDVLRETLDLFCRFCLKC